LLHGRFFIWAVAAPLGSAPALEGKDDDDDDGRRRARAGFVERGSGQHSSMAFQGDSDRE